MLERAVRCIENATQHVYLGSKYTLRSRRLLHPRFWHPNTDDSTISLLYYYIYQSTSKKTFSACHKDAATLNSTNCLAPLEFLYPPKTQLFARTYVSEPKKCLGRRKRYAHRAYSSSASKPVAKEIVDTDEPLLNDIDLGEAPKALRSLLFDKSTRNYDTVWELYRASGCPEEVESELLSYLSHSQHLQDFHRCRTLFEKLPLSHRSEHDYLNITRVTLNTKSPSRKMLALKICNEAISRKKTQCWHFAFMDFLNDMDWINARQIWRRRPRFLPQRLRFPGTLQTKFLANRLHAYLKEIQRDQSRDDIEMSRYILQLVMSDDKLMMAVPMKEIIGMIESARKLELFSHQEYIQMITTLASSGIRSANGRSIFLYRNYRWRIPEHVPPKALITHLIRMLCRIEVLEGVDYLLAEYRMHYGLPSKSTYYDALTVAARLGDTSTTMRIYNDYLTDYGEAASLDGTKPVLYSYARTGDVKQTQKWFDHITKFGTVSEIEHWNILLSAYLRDKDIEGAFRIFRRMLKVGRTPDAISFTILMSLSAGRGDVNAVMDLFDMAKQNRVRLASPMYNTLIEALCKERRYSEAEKVAEETTSIFPADTVTRTWNILLWNYAFTVDFRSMSRIQNRMRDAGVRFDGMTYGALMSALVRVGKTDSARKILGVLHRNHEISLTLFHYSILLHGYVQQKNRDMVQVIYLEMMGRFNKVDMSGTLAMLKSEIDRDLQRARETMGKASSGKLSLPHAEELLQSAIESFDSKDFSTKQSQVGASGRSLREAFPTVYYEHLIHAYGDKNGHQRVGELFLELSAKSKTGLTDRLPKSPKILHALMVNYLSQKKHYELKKCFEAALAHTLQKFRAINVKRALKKIPRLPNDNADPPADASLYNDTPAVLSSHRFDLSHCISTYMQSLMSQGQHLKVVDIEAQVKKLGFEFSTKNWSLFVNILCLSQDPAAQARAFMVFERKFIPNYPGWRYIKRGYALRPEGAPMDMDQLEGAFRRGKPGHLIGQKVRALWAQLHPEYMQPTYSNMLHLASALIDFRSRSIADGGIEMNELFSKAPETYTAVATIPYLERRFDKILRKHAIDRKSTNNSRGLPVPEHEIRTEGVLGVERKRISADNKKSGESTYGEGFEFDKQDPSKEELERLEDSGSSEPQSPLLENLLADDMISQKRKMLTRHDSTPMAERILSPEDEWDLDNESFLSSQTEPEAE